MHLNRNPFTIVIVLTCLLIQGTPLRTEAQGVVKEKARLAEKSGDTGDKGWIVCRVTENGAAVSGTLVIKEGENVIAQGSCGNPIAVSAGQYTVTIQLDGVLDRPEQRKEVAVQKGKTEKIGADFSTGFLEVAVQTQGRKAAAMLTVLKGGTTIGTVACGVPTRLSEGEYEIMVSYRGKEKREPSVRIEKAQRNSLTINLD